MAGGSLGCRSPVRGTAETLQGCPLAPSQSKYDQWGPPGFWGSFQVKNTRAAILGPSVPNQRAKATGSNSLSSETHLPSPAAPEARLLSLKQEKGWTELTQRASGLRAEGGWETTRAPPHIWLPLKTAPPLAPQSLNLWLTALV